MAFDSVLVTCYARVEDYWKVSTKESLLENFY